MTHDDSRLKFWVGFNLVDGIGTIKTQHLQQYFGSLEAAWNATDFQLQQAGIDLRARKKLRAARSNIDLDQEIDKNRAAGINILTLDSQHYPELLRQVPYPPPLLYVKGEIRPEDEYGLGVVGTRKMSAYGRQITRELVADLVRHQITITSGLARGIDTIAHHTALQNGGRTLAVLGSGIDEIYPPENKALANEIINSGQGAIISEYALGTKPRARNFPPRNRIISGLTAGTLIVEGGRKSGAMITAQFAAEQNRELFAVPGNINSPLSSGPHELIQQGAKLVTCVTDILEEVAISPHIEPAAIQLALPQTPIEAQLLAQLDRTPQHIDDLCRAANIPAAVAGSTLTMLELRGVVQHVGQMKYTLATYK